MEWWQRAVFYQIYPRSFSDSNGDGIGDLPGIITRLDYLQDLGIDAIWLSPHYPSPLWDCGYDVSDYRGVAPEYGTLDDFKALLAGVKQRGMRIVLDLVLNHTSNQHPWFQASLSGKDNQYRDWYIWKDGMSGGPPNNWYSTFGGPAWDLDPISNQYYYHFFFKEQPDLNWRNEAVHQAMYDVMRYWMDLGVDGYRLDAIGTIYEDPRMPNQQAPMSLADLHRFRRTATMPTEIAWLDQVQKEMFKYQHDLPEIHKLMRDLREVNDEYPERVLIGETDDIAYYGNGCDELNLVFNFPLMHTNRLTSTWVRENQKVRLSQIPKNAWPCNTLGNHDSPRLLSHFGDGLHNSQIARLSLALMLSLKGTPFLYNGEEIGMTDLLLADVRQFRDMLGVWLYETEVEQFGASLETALVDAARLTRDKCRTPMQWANQVNAGFCPPGIIPWLPVNPNYIEGVNVADQVDDPDSLFNFYRNYLRLRKANPALIDGDFHLVDKNSPDYLGFTRHSEASGQRLLVLLNFSGETITADSLLTQAPGKRIYSTHIRQKEEPDVSHITLAPFEVYVVELFQ